MRPLVTLALVGALGGTALAQRGDTAAQVKLIETQPAGMDRATWKEQRRDAARRLVQRKDKAAVPTLIRLAETEPFDIIGEIAIEGLGVLGDPAATPVLQKIAADPARDPAQRDLARRALAKLPAAGAPPPADPPPAVDDAAAGLGASGPGDAAPTPSVPTPPAGGALLDAGPGADAPSLPALPEDTLAASERITFAAGVASFGYDTVRKRAAFDVDVGGTYAKRIEREAMAWGVDLGAHLVAGLINPEGREQVRGAQVNVAGGGEVRFYAGTLYGVGKAALGSQITYVSNVDDDNPDADFKDTRTTLDVQVALGGGYGRVVDVGAAIRVRRLARTLDAARALGKPIDAGTARRLQLTWWSLRGERSTYAALVATVAILREAGVLLGEPDAGLAYEILNVLRDSGLLLRPRGLDVQVTLSEGYLYRPDYPDGAPTAARQHGRVEQLLALAGYGTQLEDDKLEISGHGWARLRLFAPDDSDPPQPSPWAIGADARMRRFTYADHGDPIGVFDLGGTIMLADDDLGADGSDDRGDLGLRLGGDLGFTWWLNQASGIRLAATVIADGGEIFMGASLSAAYGLLDATFAGL